MSSPRSSTQARSDDLSHWASKPRSRTCCVPGEVIYHFLLARPKPSVLAFSRILYRASGVLEIPMESFTRAVEIDLNEIEAAYGRGES